MKAGEGEYTANRFAENSSFIDEIPTILPPSLTNLDDDNDEDVDKNASSSDDEGNLPPAVQKVQSMEKDLAIHRSDTKEMEVTLSLHRSMSTVSNDWSQNQKVDAASVHALPSFSPPKTKLPPRMLPSALRKVRSMDPRMNAKNVTIDPHEVVRTWSKTVVHSSGEVELEPVAECDSRSESTSQRA
jgi:hypothetical protein